MPDPKPPQLNKQGREIWFKEAEGETGFAPIHRKGCIAFLLGFAWIGFSGIIGMVMIVLWTLADFPLPIAMVTPFLVAAPGVVWLGRTVRRHS